MIYNMKSIIPTTHPGHPSPCSASLQCPFIQLEELNEGLGFILGEDHAT